MKTILMALLSMLVVSATAQARARVVAGNAYERGPDGTCEVKDSDALVARMKIVAEKDATDQCGGPVQVQDEYGVYTSCMKPAYDDAQRGVQEYYQVVVSATFECR